MKTSYGTKHWPFGFQDWVGNAAFLLFCSFVVGAAPRIVSNWGCENVGTVAPCNKLCMSAGSPREGDEELSAKKPSETEGARHSRRSKKISHSNAPAGSTQRGAGKHRSGDLGRALRSAYDDTLREAVPDDFMDLIGKLT